jgi:hypothetical protein
LRGLAVYSGTKDDALRLEIETLAALIRAEQLELHAAVAALPPEIATHDRIIDTRRALARASDALLDISRSRGP